MSKQLIVAAVAALSAVVPSWAQDKSAPLVKETEWALEGGSSFDYVWADSAGGRLYVGHSPKIDVLDLKTGKKLGEVEGVDGAHGAIAVSEVKKGFATAGRKNKLIVFDLESFKVSQEIETGANPDALIYVSSTKEVWTFNGRGQSVTCVDASTLEVKATIKVGGKPEAAVEDAAKGVVYVNLEDKSEIAAIDAKKHEVIGTHSLDPGKSPTGLAFDAKNGLLFAGCNKKLVVMDAGTWKVVTTLDINAGCDGVVFDSGSGVILASCGGGCSVVLMKDAKTFESAGTLEGKGKTSSVDLKTHKIYVASGPGRNEKGNVKITVYGPKK